MPLQAILEQAQFESLDESLKTLYKQNDENKQFYLDISPDDAGKLAFNLQKEKEKLAENNALLLKQKGEAKALAKSYESLGKSPEELAEFLKSNRPEEITKLVEKYESEKESLKNSYEEPLAQARSKAERLQSELISTLQQTAIARLRADNDLNETADFVLRDFIRVEQAEGEDGKFAVRVYENGSPALVAGQPKAPQQLLDEWRQEKRFASIFNAPNGGGTGASNRQNRAGETKAAKYEEIREKVKSQNAQAQGDFKDRFYKRTA